MNQAKITGIGTIAKGAYDDVYISGKGTISGDITFHSMIVSGFAKSEGELEGNLLVVEGSFHTEKDIRVKRLNIDGLMKSVGTKIYADEIDIDGMLKSEDEVNADVIDVDGCISAKCLYGDTIKIDYHEKGWNSIFHLGFFTRRIQDKMNRMEEIECSELKAGNLTCDVLSAHEITLKHGCRIKTIHCDGILRYDSSCQIGDIQGECKIIKI